MAGENDLQANAAGDYVEVFRDEFDFDALDSLEDRIKEAIAKGESIEPTIKGIVDERADERAMDAVWRAICIIKDSKKPKLIIDYLACCVGASLNDGESHSAMARKHRMSKQAFSQGLWKLIKKLGLKPSRQMRSTKAKASMAAAYRARQAKDNKTTRTP